MKNSLSSCNITNKMRWAVLSTLILVMAGCGSQATPEKPPLSDVPPQDQQKIAAIRNNPALSPQAKEQAIKALQQGQTPAK